MAEPGVGANVDRRLLFVTTAVVSIISLVFLWSFRGCVGGRERGYTVIYSNLDLKDAANVVTRLQELKIPYELKDEGTTVAVPKEKASTARLGLAEKNLPLGGVVGWEIFDEAKLGATDFDRRIQLIRAISGELSRTIRRIDSVEECRVQIVLPETKLFEVAKAPVTASVMIKMVPGKKLSPGQVKGIVHLVASSVENLKPENVTIVDDHGRILTVDTIIAAPLSPKAKRALPPVEVPKKVVPVVVATKETKKAEKVLSLEEKALLVLKAKRELENQLEARAQTLLNRFYPPNSVIIKVNLELENGSLVASKNKKAVKQAFKFKTKRLTAVVLVDNRFNLTEKIKKDTFSTVAGAIGYNRRRGDRIELRRVPFHYAVPPPSEMAGRVKEMLPQEEAKIEDTVLTRVFRAAGIFLVGLVVFVLFVVLLMRRKQAPPPREELVLPPEETEKTEEQHETTGSSSLVHEVKKMANESPEKIANLLKTWLTEK